MSPKSLMTQAVEVWSAYNDESSSPKPFTALAEHFDWIGNMLNHMVECNCVELIWREFCSFDGIVYHSDSVPFSSDLCCTFVYLKSGNLPA